MDPVTQGALGAAAAQLVLGKRLGRRTWLYGCLGGLAADADIFIRSASDPLVGIIYHRHFTHSLAFVPVGGLIVALPWLVRTRFFGQRKAILAATTIGYATHALLDCCTSYGTLYLWPFSQERIAWAFMSIVDLIYTLPLVLGVWLSARSGSLRPVKLAFIFSHAYMALCGFQKHRALELRDRLAERRGHQVLDSFSQNLILSNVGWRSLYRDQHDVMHADVVYTPLFGEALVREGESKPVGSIDDLPTRVREHPEARRGFEVYEWFSSGWFVVEAHADTATVCDQRYSSDPATFEGRWCAMLDPDAESPVVRVGAFPRDGAAKMLERSFLAPAAARPVE